MALEQDERELNSADGGSHASPTQSSASLGNDRSERDAGPSPIELTPAELAIAREEDREPGFAERDTAPTAGTEASSEPLATGNGGTDAAGVQPDKAWYGDQHRELAASYGLTEDDLKSFGDEDEFSRAALFYDRRLIAGITPQQPSGGNAGTGGPPQPPTQQTQAPPAPAAPSANQPPAAGAGTPPAAPTTPPTSDDLDPQKYIDAGYDAETVALVRALRAEQDRNKQFGEQFNTLKTSFETFQQQVFQAHLHQEQARKNAAFHDAVDALGDAKRFGKSRDDSGRFVSLSKEADDNRRKVYEMADTLQEGIIATARKIGQEPKVPPYSILVHRARQLVFGEDLRREDRDNFRQQVTRQSARRRPVAATRPVATARAAATSNVAPAGQMDEVAELMANPAITKAWNAMREEAGR